jgi:predicted GIY-YIG superfamily endonuclease
MPHQPGERRPLFSLGLHPLDLMEFTLDNIDDVPTASGVYIIYEPTGPFYVGRSGSNIQQRLRNHFNGKGNKNVKLAMKIKEFRETLTFTYALISKDSQKEVEGVLIADLSATTRANMIHAGMYEEQFTD